MTPSPTNPTPCTHCGGLQYLITRKGGFAIANRCPHCKHECPVCHGDGYIFTENKLGYRFVQECASCTALEHRIETFNKARLPALYHDATLEKFTIYSHEAQENGNLRIIRDQMNRLAQEFYPGKPGCILCGQVGVGKTHLIASLVRHFTLHKGFSCRFIEFTHLLSTLRESYERRTNSTALLNFLATVPVLFIDEIGAGRNNEWQLSIIDEMISKRYNNGLSTFGTTNFSLDSKPRESHPSAAIDTTSQEHQDSLKTQLLVERIGERIVSRLFQMSHIYTIEGVEDYRATRRVQDEKPLNTSPAPATNTTPTPPPPIQDLDAAFNLSVLDTPRSTTTSPQNPSRSHFSFRHSSPIPHAQPSTPVPPKHSEQEFRQFEEQRANSIQTDPTTRLDPDRKNQKK